MTLKSLFISCFIGAIVFSIIYVFVFHGELPMVAIGNSKKLVVPVSGDLIKPPSETPKLESGLGKAVGRALAGTQGTYAIEIKNLKTGEKFSANDRRSFESASLYKLWVMGTVYKEIQKGFLSEDQVLSKTITELNKDFKISEEDAELTEGGITLTVKSALTQMITISHNYAAFLLTEKVGLSKVRAFLSENGLSDSTVGEVPRTTAHDAAIFLEKLYRGQLANEQYTKEMIDLLKNQRLNGKLPKYLPDYVTIGHKTGELGTFSHDAGIVYSTTGDYVIVVLTETDNPDGANDRIGLVSKAVYQYFQKI